MNIVIALIVLSSAIAIVFAQEFSTGFKKVLSFPGMALLLPLFLISYFLMAYQPIILWLLTEFNQLLWLFIGLVEDLFPFQKGNTSIVSIGLLTIIALIPHGIMAYRNKRNIFTPFRHTWLVSFVSWLVLMMLIVIK